LTVTPQPWEGEPPTGGSTTPVELFKWILDDHGRAAWVLVYTLIGVAAGMALVWVLGPAAVNVIISGLLGGGVGAGGAAAITTKRKRRRHRSLICSTPK
jgi:hypothetical protein